MKPKLTDSLLFTCFALLAGLSSCAAGIYSYVGAFVNNCTLVDRFFWLSLPLLLAVAALIFRRVHPLAGGPSQLLRRRTWVLMAVMTVLWIGPWVIMPGQTGAIDRGRQKRTMADMRTIGYALEAHFNAHGAYPETSNPLELEQALTELKAFPTLDGWRQPLVFRISGSGYTIVSLGKCCQPDIPSSSDYQPSATTSFRSDIVYANGEFIRWPEGIQTD